MRLVSLTRFGLSRIGLRAGLCGASARCSRRRSPAGHHPVTATLKARIEALQAELAKVEALAAVQRADFERERADRLMTELLATADTLAAKEAAARLDGELSALRSRPWWPRMVWAEAGLLPVRHPGGRVGCNRSSKPVAQCISAAGPCR
jgi:hypothetical protein